MRTDAWIFDLDRTLRRPGKVISEEMRQLLVRLRETHVLVLVSTSDTKKVMEACPDALDVFDLVCPENGLVTLSKDATQKLGVVETYYEPLLIDHIEEVKYGLYNRIICDLMWRISVSGTPVMTGNFFDLRRGVLNVTGCGRVITDEEQRTRFAEWDAQTGWREKMVEQLNTEFGERYGLVFAMGGKTGFDLYPKGWGKDYCLRHVERLFPKVNHIRFTGDRCDPGGNDFDMVVARFQGKSIEVHPVQDTSGTLQVLRRWLFHR